jgi:hypothetical protein
VAVPDGADWVVSAASVALAAGLASEPDAGLASPEEQAVRVRSALRASEAPMREEGRRDAMYGILWS